ncbi:ABC transporter, substrate-binding protein, family 3 [Streptococcus porcinus str. Jelinkova 176]|uniref:Extracellular solute-binding protein n=3 Tax=Streptococcus porcinus TaxID=1340 RepID=A0A4V0H8Y7_STRPO|nr:ABC transporter, substrate-binding protein, family 3 [Streptococcus porcinus str. Jelinkova 176]SQG45084.1 extracellular solute-binding protein [Streptococcus porcinus]VTT45840.1 extracellular solute-binding protein [Streptococcus porcinus]VTT47202.1 extracellular solute-binding protein [Streptococcus porcinus]
MMAKKNISFISLLLFASLVFMTLGIATEVSAKDKEVITVATDAATKPFTYKDGKTLTGYDIQVLKAIFKNSKQYELKFETVAFPSILSGIDAGRYQIAANDYGYSAERAQKYLFSKAISKSNYALATKGNKGYKQLADLSGKKTQGMSGANYMQVLEKWNKKHPKKKPIEITYASGSTPFTQRLQMLENGQLDFLFYDAISLKTAIKEQGYDLKITKLTEKVGDEKDGLEYFIFSDDAKGKELQSYVNKGLGKLKKSGQLKQLSQKFFEGDFVSSLK